MRLREEAKKSLKIWGYWFLLSSIALAMFLILGYTIFPNNLRLIRSIEKGMLYTIAEDYQSMADEDEAYIKQLKELNTTFNCSDECKLEKILDWFYPNGTWIREEPLKEFYGEKDCKSYAYTFYILAKLNGLDSKICVTKNHMLNLVKVNRKWIVVDPANNEIGDSEFLDYLICGR